MLFFFAAPPLLAEEDFFDPSLNVRVLESCAYADIAYGENPRVMEGAFGYLGYANDYLAFYTGLAFLAPEVTDILYSGLKVGVRLGMGRGFTPFVGLGAFIGYGTQETDSEQQTADQVTVSISETDESTTTISDSIATIHPEAGLSIPMGRGYRMILCARRHLVSKGRDFDFWSFSIGMTFRIQ